MYLLMAAVMLVSTLSKNLNNELRCSDPEQCPRSWAMEHRPLIRFDGGAEDNCYPDEASNANNGLCAPFRQDAPIYYKIVRCGDFLKLAWHLWYGLQRGCDPFGLDPGHDDDWEHVTINFIRSGASWVQDSVTFSQHGGFYTRQITHKTPDVYVGKVAHGHYDTWCDGTGLWPHPNFCTGVCGYWEDFRNDNEHTQWLPSNIKHVSEVSRSEDQVNRILEYKYFDEAYKHRCNGHSFRCIGALGFCACWRNNHTFPAPICDV